MGFATCTTVLLGSAAPACSDSAFGSDLHDRLTTPSFHQSSDQIHLLRPYNHTETIKSGCGQNTCLSRYHNQFVLVWQCKYVFFWAEWSLVLHQCLTNLSVCSSPQTRQHGADHTHKLPQNKRICSTQDKILQVWIKTWARILKVFF